MILKKPYAFLIKQFRLIHLILTFLIGFLAFKTYNLYNYFIRYINNIYAALGNTLTNTYITIFMYLIVIIIVAFSLAMFMLMKQKKKPKTLYVALSIYYIIYFIFLIILFLIFKSMEQNPLSIKKAMILRDINLLMLIPQLLFFIISLIRGLGFDIKKFNFSKDVKALDLNEKDSEEFEFVLGIDSYKYFRFIRKKIREFKYYYLENKFLFTVLIGLLSSILAIILILNFTVYNKTYKISQKLFVSNLNLKINSAILTNKDYKNKIIEQDKYFLIVNISFENKSGSSTVLDLTNYKIKIGNEAIYPTLTRNNYFIDLGQGYDKERLENNSTNTYILVYELNKKQYRKTYNMYIIDTIDYKSGTINTKSKHVLLKPYITGDDKITGEYNIKDKVTLYDSILYNSDFELESYEFKDTFSYKYQACVRNNCQEVNDIINPSVEDNKVLIILNSKLNLDKTSPFMTNEQTKNTFYDTFTYLKYDNKVSPVKDLTPPSIIDKTILEVDKNATKSNNIDFIIKVRDKKYIINLN